MAPRAAPRRRASRRVATQRNATFSSILPTGYQRTSTLDASQRPASLRLATQRNATFSIIFHLGIDTGMPRWHIQYAINA
jgi:hypothetical protein